MKGLLNMTLPPRAGAAICARQLAVLRNGRPHTRREILQRSNALALNGCISELRANGAELTCTRERGKDRLICRYAMTGAPG